MFKLEDYLIHARQKLKNYSELFNSEPRTQKEIHDFNGYYNIASSSCRIIERFKRLNKEEEEIINWKLKLEEYLLKIKNILEK